MFETQQKQNNKMRYLKFSTGGAEAKRLMETGMLPKEAKVF